MSRAVVVGGGVTGLAAARRLAAAGWSVTVCEATPRWGGKIASVEIDGVRLDSGAESVLARRPEALALIEELGLGPAQVHPTAAKPRLLVEDRLHPMPPSLQGVPTDLDALRDLLSPAGWTELQRRHGRGDPLPGDVGIGTVVDDRFGPEVTDRVLEPLLGGVYAGRARELSFAAVSGELYRRAAAGGSLLEHARAAVRPSDGTPVFAGLTGGIATLVDVLVADLDHQGADLRTATTVRGLERDGRRWAVTVQQGDRTDTLTADAVLLTAPAPATGRLLAGLTAAGADWASLPYASVAVVTLVVRGLAPDSSGVLLPPRERPSIKALTHSSVKWDWVAEQARATWGDDVAVIRTSVGRLGEEYLLQVDDEALVRRTVVEAQTLPGWAGAEVRHARVTRWGGGLPQYTVGHRDRVAALRAQLAGLPGVAVAGAALDGVGIAACLGSAQTAVTKIMTDSDAARGGMDGDPEVEESSR